MEDFLISNDTTVHDKFDIIIGVSTGSIIGGYIIKNKYTIQKYKENQNVTN